MKEVQFYIQNPCSGDPLNMGSKGEPHENELSIGWKFERGGQYYGNYILMDRHALNDELGQAFRMLYSQARDTEIALIEKENQEKGPKAVGIIQIKDEDLEESDKTPEELLTPKITPSDTNALEIVGDYIEEHLDKSDKPVLFNLFIVWKCKALQNWKYLISSTLPDGMYYELTYNGNKGEWYLDAYKKFENRVIQRRTSEGKAHE